MMDLVPDIKMVGEACLNSIQNGNKIILAGNGRVVLQIHSILLQNLQVDM